MKFVFCHTTAVYSCTKCAEKVERHGGTSITLPYLLWALPFAIAFSIRLMCPPWSLAWYTPVSVYAGELLLFFISGMPLTLLGIARERHFCRKCKAPIFLNGRYYRFSPKPRWEDYAILVIHGLLNLLIWMNLAKFLAA